MRSGGRKKEREEEGEGGRRRGREEEGEGGGEKAFYFWEQSPLSLKHSKFKGSEWTC